MTPEIGRIVKKMRLVTEDEELQNGLYLPKIWDLIKEGKRCHQIDGGYGEFGREKTNPVPVNGALGEVTYISRLVKKGVPEGQPGTVPQAGQPRQPRRVRDGNC